MARIALWNGGRKSADYHFQDRQISQFFNASGTALYIHLYQGVYDDKGGTTPITTIQDVLFQENRDRKYSDNVFEMRGCYNVQDNDFDLRQFGFFMRGDTLFIEVHLNDMFALLSRRIMAGDVIELPHQRDDMMLDGGEAVNKYYVVESASKASSGYSSTWYPHVWRVKISPMTGAQEYADILDKATLDPFGLETGSTLGDIISTLGKEQATNDAILAQAKINVLARNFETRQFYFVPGEELGDQLPWIFAGDGVPPNGAVLLGSGKSFPTTPAEGDYYLRTDYSPNVLFRRKGSIWQVQELDYRMGKWSAATRLLDSMINDDATTTLSDGTVVPQKVALSKAVRPSVDF